MHTDGVMSVSGWFPHVFWFLNSVIKLGQLPRSDCKAASGYTPTLEFFLLSLAFYYPIFPKNEGRGIISVSPSQQLGGQAADSLVLQGTVLRWCHTEGRSTHKRNHLETRGACVFPLILFINSNFRHTQSSRRSL